MGASSWSGGAILPAASHFSSTVGRRTIGCGSQCSPLAPRGNYLLRSGGSMLAAYVSDEYYAALAGVMVEARAADGRGAVYWSAPSGAVDLGLLPGEYEVC